MSFRRSKIVCTLGPASNSAHMIERLIRAGMDVARLNFSHGTHETHAKTVSRIRAAAIKRKAPCIIADLSGQKIRTGALEGGLPVTLRAGQKFTIETGERTGTRRGLHHIQECCHARSIAATAFCSPTV